MMRPNENAKLSKASKITVDQRGNYMAEKWYQIIGLVGFIIAGLLFVAVGVNAGDMLTIVASIIWTLSCLVWLVPLFKSS